MGQDFLDIQYASVLVTVEFVQLERWEEDTLLQGYTNISSAKAPCSGKPCISLKLFCQAQCLFAREGVKD